MNSEYGMVLWWISMKIYLPTKTFNYVTLDFNIPCDCYHSSHIWIWWNRCRCGIYRENIILYLLSALCSFPDSRWIQTSRLVPKFIFYRRCGYGRTFFWLRDKEIFKEKKSSADCFTERGFLLLKILSSNNSSPQILIKSLK